MITFTETDFNLSKIKRESKLFNLVTRYKYHVYGLRQINNPTIQIDYPHSIETEDFLKNINGLVEFFTLNGISVGVTNDSTNNRIDIGLRKDLRSVVNISGNAILAASILSTIVYCLEGRADIEQMKKYKVSSIPAFPDVEPLTVIEATLDIPK